MVTVTIPIKTHLANFMKVRYKNCMEDGVIRLSPRSQLYQVLLELTEKMPKNASGRQVGNLTLALPCPDIGKSPKTHNYLSDKSIRILEKEIKNEMLRVFVREVDRKRYKEGIAVEKTIYQFIKEYNLVGVTEEALKRFYYRLKEKEEEDRLRGWE